MISIVILDRRRVLSCHYILCIRLLFQQMRHPDGLNSTAFDCSLALLERLVRIAGNNEDHQGCCQHIVAMVIRSVLCAHDIAQVSAFATNLRSYSLKNSKFISISFKVFISYSILFILSLF